uniref:Uncharacterized protein n=1 Tax=Knipowitschia caucasica TaxID=637954 RepID=A0AAV2ME90_KNICA
MGGGGGGGGGGCTKEPHRQDDAVAVGCSLNTLTADSVRADTHCRFRVTALRCSPTRSLQRADRGSESVISRPHRPRACAVPQRLRPHLPHPSCLVLPLSAASCRVLVSSATASSSARHHRTVLQTHGVKPRAPRPACRRLHIRHKDPKGR